MAGQDQPTTTSPPSASASNDGSSGRHGIDEQIAERRAKLAALAAAGVAVHPYRFDRTATTAELHASYADLAPDAHTGVQARVAGRLLAVRGHGKLEFADLHDESGRIQLLLEHDKLDEQLAAGGRQPRRGRLGRGRGRGGHVAAGASSRSRWRR